jgi:hypothetical protein
MPQRQPRLGDILDDYCPRERRLTNHAVVAMIGDAVRLTRCTTCDAEHDYKEGRLPRPRKKIEAGALALPPTVVPKRVVHEPSELPAKELTESDNPILADSGDGRNDADESSVEVEAHRVLMRAPEPRHEEFAVAEPQSLEAVRPPLAALDDDGEAAPADGDAAVRSSVEEGPVHRQLIRAQLPRLDNQPPAPRQAPDFTIRQPGGRPNRFRARPARNGVGFQGPSFRSNGGSPNGTRGGGPRPAGQPPLSRAGSRQGPPRKRSK